MPFVHLFTDLVLVEASHGVPAQLLPQILRTSRDSHTLQFQTGSPGSSQAGPNVDLYTVCLPIGPRATHLVVCFRPHQNIIQCSHKKHTKGRSLQISDAAGVKFASLGQPLHSSLYIVVEVDFNSQPVGRPMDWPRGNKT